jgi:hypothetical protein
MIAPEPPPTSSAAQWAARALAHAQALSRLARGSATPGEAKAAELVRQELCRLGVDDIRTQAFTGQRSSWLFTALALGCGLIGHAAAWLLVRPLGAWPALLISFLGFGFGLYLFWRKYTFRPYPLRASLPHGPSQNVVAVLPPAGAVQQRAVLVAHLDSHRAVLWYAHDWLLRIFSFLSPVTLAGLLLAPLLYLLAALSGWAGWAWLALPLVLLHFVGWLSGVTADLGPLSPGANDNAASVGALLALVERLQTSTPLPHTELWLAFTGCEETGGDGFLALLKDYGPQLKDAYFLDLEMIGIGPRLVYLETEGLVRPRRIPAAALKPLQVAGPAFGLQPLRGAGLGAYTEAGMAWEHGYCAACVMALAEGSILPPEWHRLTDVPDRLQLTALERAQAFVWAWLGALEG